LFVTDKQELTPTQPNLRLQETTSIIAQWCNIKHQPEHHHGSSVCALRPDEALSFESSTSTVITVSSLCIAAQHLEIAVLQQNLDGPSFVQT
jgi:hypothetical protein